MRKPQSILHIVLPLIAALALSACAPAAAIPAPTQTVSAIYTAAFNTFTAQQATQHAVTPTAAAPSPAPTTGAASAGVPITGGGTAAAGGAAATAALQCNNSVYINDVTIPDGTVMAPTTPFTKTWTVMNNGTCPWTTGYKLVFINGESMGGTSVPITATVPAGAQAKLSVNLTSPVLPGNYTGGWMLEDPQGNRFGEMITVVIVVSGTGGTNGTTGASITATP